MSNEKLTSDPMVNRILHRCINRSEAGMIEYGMSIEENPDKDIIRWFNDIQEELWDAIVYIEKAKQVKSLPLCKCQRAVS